MKRYLLFVGDIYYPGRGMEDFVSHHDTLDEIVRPELDSFRWYQIYDSERRMVVELKTKRGEETEDGR